MIYSSLEIFIRIYCTIELLYTMKIRINLRICSQYVVTINSVRWEFGIQTRCKVREMQNISEYFFADILKKKNSL